MKLQISSHEIENALLKAAKLLPSVWPLTSQIAVNPIWDLRDQTFVDAIRYVRQFLKVNGFLEYGEYVSLYESKQINRHHLARAMQEKKIDCEEKLDEICDILTNKSLIKAFDEQDELSYEVDDRFEEIKSKIIHFISCYFDETLTTWYSKTTSQSFFKAWKEHVSLNSNDWQQLFVNLPDEPLKAIQFLIVNQNYPSDDLTHLFSYLFSQLLGWHGFIKWLSSRETNPFVAQSANLVELALIWLCYCYYYKIDLSNLTAQVKPEKFLSNYQSVHELIKKLPTVFMSMTLTDLTFLWQRAYEISYEQGLISSLAFSSQPQKSPIAQFVFCIDARSELIRRHIETQNNYETFGYAGFFGSIFTLQDDQDSQQSLQAPALVEPKLQVNKKKSPQSFKDKYIRFLGNTIKSAKNHLLSPFAFFELIGGWVSLALISKTFIPHSCKKADNQLSYYENPFLAPEQLMMTVKNMSAFLKTIGISSQFSRWVFICGHEPTTNNNPYHASFACGACGGNSGFVNAKMTCEILNNPKVRKALVNEGINIPHETYFVPAIHKTTTDELLLDTSELDNHDIPANIIKDIEKSTLDLKNERMAKLPGKDKYNNRACHWAELVPEWGLANNAALIIGPRQHTSGVNLQGRTFLHSYNSDLDQDGAILEGILTAPLIVAHWINSQYYFSATDPEVYGAGNKAIHNVIGNIGVIEGNTSDLKIGLPLQSIFFQRKRMHQPLKLLVVIFAQLKILNQVLERQPQIKALFDNGWVNLHVINSEN